MKNRRGNKKKGGRVKNKTRSSSSTATNEKTRSPTGTPTTPRVLVDETLSHPPFPSNAETQPCQCICRHGIPADFAEDVGMNEFGSFVEDFLDDSEDFCDYILGLMRKLQITHPARYLYGAAANAMLERSSDVNVNDKWNLVQALLRSAIFLEKGHSILGLPPEEREQVRDRMSHVRLSNTVKAFVIWSSTQIRRFHANVWHASKDKSRKSLKCAHVLPAVWRLPTQCGAQSVSCANIAVKNASLLTGHGIKFSARYSVEGSIWKRQTSAGFNAKHPWVSLIEDENEQHT